MDLFGRKRIAQLEETIESLRRWRDIDRKEAAQRELTLMSRTRDEESILTMSVPSRSEVFAKMSDLINEMISCAAMMAHLHNTEGNAKDQKLGVGWLMMSEAFKAIRQKIIMLGQGRLN